MGRGGTCMSSTRGRRCSVSTGYGEGGSISRLVCVGPPDTGGGGAGGATPTQVGPTDFIPNIFLAGSALGFTGTLIAIGVQDFAIEVWAMPFAVAVAPQASHWKFHSGSGGGGGLWFLHEVGGLGPYVRASFDRDIPPGGFINGTDVLMPSGWHHYAANFDRNANCVVYVDGVAADTFAIGAGAADVLSSWIRGFYNSSIPLSCSVAYGPVAFHINTLLALAQIRNSVRLKNVQNLGAAITQARWDARDLVGHTGWERASTSIRGGCHLCGPGVDIEIPAQYAAPIGVNGTVTVPDTSGNGESLPILTDTAYSAASLANSVFGTDPFWR